MSTFSCVVFDPATNTTRHEVVSGSAAHVRASLEGRGLSVISMSESKGSSNKRSLRKLSRDEQIQFCRGMALQLRAGLDTAESLRLYASSSPAHIRPLLEEASELCRSGNPLSFALQRTGLFPDTFIGVVQAGDAANAPGEAMLQLAEKLKVDKKLAGAIQKTAIIPTIVLIISSAILVGSQLFIVPKVKETASIANAGDDPLSAAIFGFNAVFQVVWIPVALLIIGFALCLFLMPSFRAFVLYLLMAQFRMIRLLIMAIRQHSFISSFRLLYQNGASVHDAVLFSAKALRGTPMESELVKAAQDYERGSSLAHALQNRTSCDERLVQLIRISEESEEFGAQLKYIEELFAEESMDRVELLSTVLNLIFVFSSSIVLALVFILSYGPIVLMTVKMMGDN